MPQFSAILSMQTISELRPIGELAITEAVAVIANGKHAEKRLANAHPLDVFFHPKSVAIIGATERAGSPGEALTRNLLAHIRPEFQVFPINPSREKIFDQPAFQR